MTREGQESGRERTKRIMAEVLAVCISRKKGEQKKPVESVTLVEDWGIDGDAHAGKWHRQVSLLGKSSVDKLQGKLPQIELKPGDFAENILVDDDFSLYKLEVGTRIRLGPDAIGEVTQIGKECHSDCAIRQQAGDCVMPREGIFLRILSGGELKAGDEIDLKPE